MVGDILAGRYEIKEVIGEGGMGVIMSARQISMDRDVAIKLVRPGALRDESARRRFDREVHLAKELAHPHIVQLFDYGREGDVAWVAMELLAGETLEDLIRREAPLELGRALDIFEQILDALTVAHRRNVVHRDLKPPNIFVTPGVRERDFVKVLDFGLARPLDESNHYVTTTGYISGTLPYMAPEVLTNNEITPSIDVYAAGLVFLEMLYGQRIFEADSPTKMALQHMRKEIPIPAILRETELGPVILKATAKRRVNRYADADSLLRAIIAVRREVDQSAVLSRADIVAAFAEVDRDVVEDLLPAPSGPQVVDPEPTGSAAVAVETSATIMKQLTDRGPKQATTQDAAPTPSPRLAIITAIVTVSLLAIGLALVLARPAEVTPRTRAPDPPPVASAAPAVESSPAATNPAETIVRVDSEPSDAQVWINGEQRFTTPVEIGIADKAEWELRKEGFASRKVLVGPDTPRLVVHLDPIPGPDEVAEAAKPAVAPVAHKTPTLTARPKSATKRKVTTPKAKPDEAEPDATKKRAPRLVD